MYFFPVIRIPYLCRFVKDCVRKRIKGVFFSSSFSSLFVFFSCERYTCMDAAQNNKQWAMKWIGGTGQKKIQYEGGGVLNLGGIQ